MCCVSRTKYSRWKESCGGADIALRSRACAEVQALLSARGLNLKARALAARFVAAALSTAIAYRQNTDMGNAASRRTLFRVAPESDAQGIYVMTHTMSMEAMVRAARCLVRRSPAEA
jgi:hypothetical protein